MSREGGQFLHEKNPDLHKTPEVELTAAYLRTGGDRVPNQPADKLAAHLDFLADPDYVNDGILTGDRGSIERQVEAHVIAPQDVPEKHFEKLAERMHEQGHGEVETLMAQMTPEMRNAEIEALQADQRASLNKWVEYLGGQDGAYPDWFKHYAWKSVTRLGVYNKETQEFSTRSNNSRGTVAPYPELNREALAYVYDKLNKTRIQAEQVEDEQLQKLLEKADFGKLYVHAVMETAPSDPELLKQIEGSWKKFDQTSDPRVARRLAESLQGHGTGWCTAGESTANNQLSNGDFYVYYTKDEDGKDTIPRVAIRMQNGEVAEVRGINPAQELEPDLADIASEQLKGLPGGEAYIKKADDMKRLTTIDKHLKANPGVALAEADIRFLYELDHDIQGFGYERDPRIDAVRQARGELDKPELVRILPEVIRDQIGTSGAAYSEVSRLLGTESLSAAELEAVFASKDSEWQANGVYSYLIDQLIENGSRYTLVTIPGIKASAREIVNLARTFGQEQRYDTYVYDVMYSSGETTGKYSDEIMSGKGDGDMVRFRLIPSRFTDELGYKPVEDQLDIMQQIQQQYPELNLQIPSHLEAVSYWYALRARGDTLTDEDIYLKTVIRHIDVPPVTIGGWSYVPNSCVYDYGGPNLYDSDATSVGYARLSVG